MKAIYWLDFGSYYAMQTGGLTFNRIGKTPIVKITRNFEDLSFFEHFKMSLFGRIARYFSIKSNTIEYEWRVMAGFEKVEWRKKENGMFVPYDDICGMEIPHLARKEPPVSK